MSPAALRKPRQKSEERLARAGREQTVITMPVARSRAPGLTRRKRWGVILAGGDGVRLQPLTKFICGDDRPKQFCPVFGDKTLLGQTLDRAKLSIPPDQILVSLAGYHCKFYSRETSLPPSQRIVQPINKGTAPPIVHSLLSIAQVDPQALVAILPSDHYYYDERAFVSALESAFEAAEDQMDSVVLLGVRPAYPELEYGWIETGAPLGREGSELYRVRKFHEKPQAQIARTLFEQGAVWNTFVMVGHVQAFLEMVRATVPDLLNEVSQARLWKGEETHIEYSVYMHISTSGFSHEVLSAETERLLVLRLNDAGWSDLGDPLRVVSAIHESGSEPGWFKKWNHAKSVAATGARKPAIA
jgi:mannose-1-phosphate guanylyltransferase